MNYIKNIIIVTLFLGIGFIGLLYLLAQSGNLNFVKKNHVKKLAQEYVLEKYPDYNADFFTVKYDWKPNIYVVTYGMENDTRQLTYDHAGEKLYLDNYRQSIAFEYSMDYKQKIKTMLEETVSQNVRKISYVLVDVNIDTEQLYQMCKSGVPITEPVDCTFGFSRYQDEEALSKEQFAKIIIATKKVIESSDFSFANLEFSYSYDINSPAYRLVWNENMSSMNAEQLCEMIES